MADAAIALAATAERGVTQDKLDGAATRLLTGPAIAGAPDRRALIAYASWLYMERQYVCHELYPHLGSRASGFVAGMNAGFSFHDSTRPAPSTRAAPVLALAGCDWSQDKDQGIGDGGQSYALSPAFPHPDARLLDLGRAFDDARTSYEIAKDREAIVRADFNQREAVHHRDEEALILHSGRFPVYWTGDYLRRILADRQNAASAADAKAIRELTRERLEALVGPVEARDARRKALDEDLGLAVLERATEAALDLREECARQVYRVPAQTLDGLALKARVLKANDPDLWTRPNWRNQVSAEWHEIALTEIADGVDYLIATGSQKGADEVYGGANVLLSSMVGGVYFEDAGTVSYTDANGKVLRTPVADWIAYTAMRLHFVARTELARQVSEHNLSPEDRQSLDRKLRRDLRIDAIHELAFRSAEAFHRADNDRRFGYDDQPPPPAWATGKISISLLRAIEAHRSAVQIAMHDPVVDDDRREAAHERIQILVAAVRDHPVRSPEDLRHKLIYLWPGALDGHVPNEGVRRTLDVLRSDFMQLVDHPPEHSVEPESISAIGEKIVPMLDRFDELWSKRIGPYEAAEAEAEAFGLVAGMTQAAQNLPMWRAYIEARRPADALSEEIEQLAFPRMDIPSTTLEDLIIKARVAASFEQYVDDVGNDVIRLMRARYGDVGEQP